MRFRASRSARVSLRSRLQFAHMLELPEAALADEVRAIEGSALFRQLVESGVLRIDECSSARFAARRFAGYELRAGAQGLGDILDGNSELVRLMTRLGRDVFEQEFLRGEPCPDDERARRCGITKDQARQLRRLVDKLYVQEEFAPASTEGAPATVFSSVAGIALDGGRPVLAFFNREIWRRRYQVDASRRDEVMSALPRAEVRRAAALLRKLELVDQRKSTLYRLLEIILDAQVDYLIARDPGRRRPLTQRAAAARLGVCPSVINRLISNKSVELPWGLDVPIKELLPNRKAVLRDQVYDLAIDRPDLSAAQIGRELRRRFGVSLSRQSISQYRIESGVARL